MEKLIMSNQCCESNRTKFWPYEQYYIGPKDSENRKNGIGEHHWTGAKSLEWYSGRFLRDTMHGVGEYYWRYIDRDGVFVTYEGHFYCNQLHGYGVMSYPDGRVFNGLFHSNIRWGPGVESHVNVREDVGIWLGTQIIRLAWKPPSPSFIPDLMTTSTGRACVEAQRSLMSTNFETVNTNSTEPILNILDEQSAKKKWIKLYPNNCTDVTSPVFQRQLFEDNYYKVGNKKVLLENEKILESTMSLQENKIYFAWNNNEIIKHVMKHTFIHDHQRHGTRLNVSKILSGPRKSFKPPAKHEMDCRTLLMASYLGYTNYVVNLVNSEYVHPDVTDILGNSALMYAVCGDQTEIMHFLVEAGASVDNYNDSCCTALSVALMRYACACREISLNDMYQALIPELNLPRSLSLENVSEWNLVRDGQVISNGLTKSSSKIIKSMSYKKLKSLHSLKEIPHSKKTPDVSPKVLDQDYANDKNDVNKSIQIFSYIENKYTANIAELYAVSNTGQSVPYIFEVNDITNEIDSIVEEQKKISEKNPKKVNSNTLKETAKQTNNLTRISNDNDESIKGKGSESYKRMMSTITQLLSDGADPGLVRCPQPALFMAVSSGCSTLVKTLIDHGANVNEFYPQVFGYSALDVAISYQLRIENLEIIRILLENKADAVHRLAYNSSTNSDGSLLPGPTLLHVMLSKKCDNEMEEEIRRQILELLLTYNCDPVEQFKGRSAIDVSMTKGAEIFDVFIKHPKVNLNAIINQSNQSVLTKMFTLPFFKTFESNQRLEILSNLLRHGADPLTSAQNDEEKYENFFVFAMKYLDELENLEMKGNSQSGNKQQESKTKKNGKNNDDKSVKQKNIVSEIEDYKQALELVTNWARRLHMFWLRTKYIKGTIQIIDRNKQRHWTMIIKEFKMKHMKSIHLWLTPQICLEIWTILKKTNKKIYKDKTILKYLLCTVRYCFRQIYSKSFDIKISAMEKNNIESEVNNLLREYSTAQLSETEAKKFPLSAITGNDSKFTVCFECSMPLKDSKLLCSLCRDVSYCSKDCMKLNTDRIDCHPCSDYLRRKYFSNFNIQINATDT